MTDFDRLRNAKVIRVKGLVNKLNHSTHWIESMNGQYYTPEVFEGAGEDHFIIPHEGGRSCFYRNHLEGMKVGFLGYTIEFEIIKE